MAMPSAAPDQTRPAGFAEISRAVVSAAADLVGTVERAVVGDANVRTARGNAWAAICADRARAQARDEMDRLVRALLADGPRSRAAGVATAAGISRAASATSASERTAAAAVTGAEGAGSAPVRTASAAEPAAERAVRAGSGSARTRPGTSQRNTARNQPAAGRRAGQNQSGVTRRAAQNQPGTTRRSGRPRTAGSPARTSATR